MMQNMSIGSNIIDIQPDRTMYKILDDKMIRYFKKNGQEFPNEVFPSDPTIRFDEIWEDCAARFPDCAMCADSLEELAEKMGVPADKLVATVERYNELCASGYDDDYGKAHQFLHAIDGKKFYAYRLSISAYGSLGGIQGGPPVSGALRCRHRHPRPVCRRQ